MAYKFQNKSGICLYNRIKAVIRNRILSGQYEPAEKLPTEDELLKQFDVSKITIRNALLHLEMEGLIVRNRGKGTFVSERIPVRKQLIYTGGVKDFIEDTKRYETKALGIHTVRVGETRIARIVRNFFSLSNEEEVGRIQRIRKLKGKPIYFIEDFMLPSVAKHLSIEALSKKPLLEILKKKIGIRIDRGEMYIESIPAETDIADLLECQPFDPLSLVQIHYWFPFGVPFEIVNCYVRGDYFRYRVDLDAKGFDNI